MGKKDPNFGLQGRDGGMGGKYARKAENLTRKELKAAGAAKAAKKRTVSISDTKRVTGKGITVGPGGKPLTGSVRLENGSMAVYKDGKRVVKAAAKKPASSSSSSSSGSSSGSTGGRTGGGMTASQKAAQRRKDNAGVANGTIRSGAAGRGVRRYNKSTGRWERVTGATGASTTSSQSRRPVSDGQTGQVPAAKRTYPNGAASSPTAAAKARGDALGLNPATGGTRTPARPYATGTTSKPAAKPKPTTSPNKRGGERRTPEQQARDTQRRYVRDQNRRSSR